MAVTVDKGTGGVRQYEDAENVMVDNGHLLVQKRNDRDAWVNVAIHAPGSWHRVEVTEAKKA
jgi:hypothetical protein